MSQPFEPQQGQQLRPYGQQPPVSGPVYGPVTGQQQPYSAQSPQQPIGYGGQQPYGYTTNAVNVYGSHAPPMPTASPKSPGVAAILSWLLPGAGHLYSGNPLWALIWFGAAFLFWMFGFFLFFGFFLLPIVYIGSPIHAYISTSAFNRRHNVVR